LPLLDEEEEEEPQATTTANAAERKTFRRMAADYSAAVRVTPVTPPSEGVLCAPVRREQARALGPSQRARAPGSSRPVRRGAPPPRSRVASRPSQWRGCRAP